MLITDLDKVELMTGHGYCVGYDLASIARTLNGVRSRLCHDIQVSR
jgi:hypothetical protein